jgi:CHAT domain-containing protein
MKSSIYPQQQQDYPAELIVLSACQTELGKNVNGEGLVGLTRGLMYAGAARVAVSLWSVNDKGTSVLMQEFYKEMLQGNKTPAAAMRTAQIKLWRIQNGKIPITGQLSPSLENGDNPPLFIG